jgi:hypothetical protein
MNVLKVREVLWESFGKLNESEISTMNMKCTNDEIQIFGNSMGLFELASYIIYVALKVDGHHVHLDHNTLFDTADKELIIAFKE